MYEQCRPYRFIFGLLCGFVLLANSALAQSSSTNSECKVIGYSWSGSTLGGNFENQCLNFFINSEANRKHPWSIAGYSDKRVFIKKVGGIKTNRTRACQIAMTHDGQEQLFTVTATVQMTPACTPDGDLFGGGGASDSWDDDPPPENPPVPPEAGSSSPTVPPFKCDYGYCPGDFNGKKVCLWCGKESDKYESGGGGEFGGGGSSDYWGNPPPVGTGSAASAPPPASGGGTGTTPPGATVPEDKPGNCEGADKDTVGCMRPGNIPQPEKVRGNDTAGNWQNGSYRTVSGCPAPRVFTAFGRVYYLRYDEVCDFGKYTKPVMLLISAIVAAYITMASFKE